MRASRAAVTAAIGARTDLSFDAGTGTLTYTGTGSPMANLVINLGAVHDSLVEGPEQYTVALTSPGSTTGSAVVGTGSVTTTITDTDTATWSISGDTGVTEGGTASYTVQLAGTLQAGETATVHLALTDISTTSADYASFTRGGDGGDRRAHRSELRCRHRHADLHRHRQPDGQPGDQPGCGQRQLGGRPRTIHGCADLSGQHHGRALWAAPAR